MSAIGLSKKEAAELLKTNGQNSLVEERRGVLKKLLVWAVSPISLMLLVAATLSYVNGSITDTLVILALFFSNFIINIWQEAKADRSIEKLRERLTFVAKVLRDGVWASISTTLLVPGDVIELRVGSVVPADASIIEAINLSINESVLTGEPIPKVKVKGDIAFSGSFVTTGKAVAKVIATGPRTSFGQTASLIEKTPRKSALEKDILSVSKFVSTVSIVVVILLSAFLLLSKTSLSAVATLDISLLIAGIPVALPTVMSLIISVGVLQLAQRSVVVRRLASLQDLANVDLLLSDKTGTLTKNKIYAERVISFGGYSEKEVVALARSAFESDGGDPFDQAIVLKANELNVGSYRQVSVVPGDSERKRTTAIISVKESGGVIQKTVSLGAAQVVGSLCKMDETTRRSYDQLIIKSAAEGYRTHVVAVVTGKLEKDMELAGIILLSDEAREDAGDTIAFMQENGISVKMVTGDNFEVAKHMSKQLGLKGEIIRRSELGASRSRIENDLDSLAGFSEVLPKDKYDIVALVRKHHVTAVTGDGVNDLPAVRSADVGFAVSSAVDALKSTADIVLTAEGIAVIKDAIVEARKIFLRLYNYSVYRISESFRLIVTIAVIGFIFKMYPLTPVQIIILAFLNDVPIVSLAFDRVKILTRPAHINPKERFTLSTLFGLVGVANSLILLYFMIVFLHLPWRTIQTMFFLKLAVSGHMLVYVAHTKERWYRFLPSRQVILATIITQLIATVFALLGLFTARISLQLVLLVWVWSFFWMQVSEGAKILKSRIFESRVLSLSNNSAFRGS